MDQFRCKAFPSSSYYQASLRSSSGAPTLSVFLIGIGAIIAIFIPDKIDQIAHKMSHMVLTKEATTQLILGILALIVGIFLAPLIFLWLGLHAGRSIIHLLRESTGGPPA